MRASGAAKPEREQAIERRLLGRRIADDTPVGRGIEDGVARGVEPGGDARTVLERERRRERVARLFEHLRNAGGELQPRPGLARHALDVQLRR
jgi:hypothetical protein